LKEPVNISFQFSHTLHIHVPMNPYHLQSPTNGISGSPETRRCLSSRFTGTAEDVLFCQTKNLVNDSRKRTIAKTHSLSPSMDIVKANTDSMSAMYFCKTIKWCHQHCTKPIYNIPKLGDPKCSHISWGRTLVLFQNRTWEFQSARRGISAALGLKSLSSWQSESPAWNRSVLVAAKGLRNKLLVAQNYRTAAGALNYPCQTQEKSS